MSKINKISEPCVNGLTLKAREITHVTFFARVTLTGVQCSYF